MNLSRKQESIIAEVIKGKRSKEIAEIQGMALSTVHTYYLRIKKKFGARTIAQAAAIYAVEKMKEAI